MLINAAFSHERLKWNLKSRAFPLLQVLWIFQVFANMKQSVCCCLSLSNSSTEKMKNSSNTEASSTHSIRFTRLFPVALSENQYLANVMSGLIHFLWYKKLVPHPATPDSQMRSRWVPQLLCFRVFCCYNARP